MVAPTGFGIALPSSGSVPSAFWEMLNWRTVDRILCMGVLCLVKWCARTNAYNYIRDSDTRFLPFPKGPYQLRHTHTYTLSLSPSLPHPYSTGIKGRSSRITVGCNVKLDLHMSSAQVKNEWSHTSSHTRLHDVRKGTLRYVRRVLEPLRHFSVVCSDLK
jgi:hypothetical protein